MGGVRAFMPDACYINEDTDDVIDLMNAEPTGQATILVEGSIHVI